MSLLRVAYSLKIASSKLIHFPKNGIHHIILSKYNIRFSTTNTIHKTYKHSKSSLITPRVKNIGKVVGIGCGLGLVLAGAQLYGSYKKSETAFANPALGGEYFLEDCPPQQKLSHSVRNPADKSGFKITLYQFQTCPFCCKVRTFLDYYGFSYDVVEVNSVTRTQTKWTKYRKVPFIIIEQDGVEKMMQLKDSSMIISALQSFIVNKNQTLEDIIKSYPVITSYDKDGKLQVDILNRYSLIYGQEVPEIKEKIIKEIRWRKWVDDVYVHMLSPNVYRTLNESFQAFRWFSKVGNWEELFATWERQLVIYVGAIAMFIIGKRLKKRHHLRDDVRESLYEETNVWLKEIKKRGGKFHGGAEPDLSDLAVYGVLTAIEGCDAFQDLLEHTKIHSWFVNMKQAVNNHRGAGNLEERGLNIKI